jgi:hypothetical protein
LHGAPRQAARFKLLSGDRTPHRKRLYPPT